MEPAALLFVEVKREAHTGVNPTLADLAQSPYSPLFGQGLSDLRQAGDAAPAMNPISWTTSPSSPSIVFIKRLWIGCFARLSTR
jgi:hypothetical protein